MSNYKMEDDVMWYILLQDELINLLIWFYGLLYGSNKDNIVSAVTVIKDTN